MSFSEAIIRTGRDQLEMVLDSYEVEPKVRKVVLFMYDNAELYITWCLAHRKDPRNPQALNGFLIEKGILVSQFSAEMCDFKNISAVIEFVADVRSDLKYSKSVYGVAIFVGLVIQDFSKFINKFEPAQRAWYEMFLKEASYRIHPPVKRPNEIQDRGTGAGPVLTLG